MTKIDIVRADITKEDCCAIVNAANPKLSNGGGVARAIRIKAGDAFQRECDRLGDLNILGKGGALITDGYNLQAKYVIHTVGPIWGQEKGQEQIILKKAYKNSIKLASKYSLKSLAFPAISCGIYGYPHDLGAADAAEALEESKYLDNLELVRFCLYGDSEFSAFQKAFQKL